MAEKSKGTQIAQMTQIIDRRSWIREGVTAGKAEAGKGAICGALIMILTGFQCRH